VHEGHRGPQVLVGAAPVAAVGEDLGGGLVGPGLVGADRGGVVRRGVRVEGLVDPDDRWTGMSGSSGTGGDGAATDVDTDAEARRPPTRAPLDSTRRSLRVLLPVSRVAAPMQRTRPDRQSNQPSGRHDSP
jgi:hypothetical protein